MASRFFSLFPRFAAVARLSTLPSKQILKVGLASVSLTTGMFSYALAQESEVAGKSEELFVESPQEVVDVEESDYFGIFLDHRSKDKLASIFGQEFVFTSKGTVIVMADVSSTTFREFQKDFDGPIQLTVERTLETESGSIVGLFFSSKHEISKHQLIMLRDISQESDDTRLVTRETEKIEVYGTLCPSWRWDDVHHCSHFQTGCSICLMFKNSSCAIIFDKFRVCDRNSDKLDSTECLDLFYKSMMCASQHRDDFELKIENDLEPESDKDTTS